VRGLLLAALLLFLPAAARGHGGLPVSTQVQRRADTGVLYVTVVYWGVWVGPDNGPWRLMCEEEINTNRLRRMALTRDGTLLATDLQGMTGATDGGCTFCPVQGGELPALRTTDVVPDPEEGGTAWVVTGSAGAKNGLFVTRDRGQTFTRVAGLALADGRQLLSVRVAATAPRTIYATSRAEGAATAPELHRSRDGGQTFTRLPISYQLDGGPPLATEVLAVDPRRPEVIYVRALSPNRHALLRSIDGGMTFRELLTLPGVTAPSGQSQGINDVAIDAARGLVLVATESGLLSAADSGGAADLMLMPTGGLSRARCVSVLDRAIYVCSSQYAPDFAAVARSDDGAKSFRSVLN
jgi:photosystem II stability/assembly factor-like uncharacterized protein